MFLNGMSPGFHLADEPIRLKPDATYGLLQSWANHDDHLSRPMDAERQCQLDIRRAARSGDDRAARCPRYVTGAFAKKLVQAEPQIFAAHDREMDGRQERCAARFCLG